MMCQIENYGLITPTRVKFEGTVTSTSESSVGDRPVLTDIEWWVLEAGEEDL